MEDWRNSSCNGLPNCVLNLAEWPDNDNGLPLIRASSSMAPRSRSPSPIHKRKTSIVSRLERCCWTTLICFPLVFVYGLTTWAIYVHNSLSLTWAASSWQGIVVGHTSIVFELTCGCRLPFAGRGNDILLVVELVLLNRRVHRSRLSTHIITCAIFLDHPSLLARLDPGFGCPP